MNHGTEKVFNCPWRIGAGILAIYNARLKYETPVHHCQIYLFRESYVEELYNGQAKRKDGMETRTIQVGRGHVSFVLRACHANQLTVIKIIITTHRTSRRRRGFVRIWMLPSLEQSFSLLK